MSAPAAITAATSSPSRAKFADRMLGAIRNVRAGIAGNSTWIRPGPHENGDHPALVSPRDFVWNDRMVAENKYEVTVSSQTQYVAEQSDERNARFVFSYTITIRNKGSLPAQLISRHWIITDGRNQVQEVRGLGVVGAQPLLKPGESFEYTSGTAIATPVGSMRGSYQMVAEDGTQFDAPIPEFTLSVPRVLH